VYQSKLNGFSFHNDIIIGQGKITAQTIESSKCDIWENSAYGTNTSASDQTPRVVRGV